MFNKRMFRTSGILLASILVYLLYAVLHDSVYPDGAGEHGGDVARRAKEAAGDWDRGVEGKGMWLGVNADEEGKEPIQGETVLDEGDAGAAEVPKQVPADAAIEKMRIKELKVGRVRHPLGGGGP